MIVCVYFVYLAFFLLTFFVFATVPSLSLDFGFCLVQVIQDRFVLASVAYS